MIPQTVLSNPTGKEKKNKKAFQLPEFVVIPKNVDKLNIAAIQGYIKGIHQKTVYRWFEEQGLRRFLSTRGHYTSRECLVEFLAKKGCTVLEELPTQTNQA